MKKVYLLPLVAFLVWGCSPAEDEDTQGSLGGVVITESDYVSGNVGFLRSDGLYTQGVTIDQDAKVVVTSDGEQYILEKSAGNLLKLDAQGGVVYQKNLGALYNPQGFVKISASRGYVCGLSSSQLYEVNPSTGVVVDSIDLSRYNHGGNTTPNPAGLAVVGNKLYVGMQRFAAGVFPPPSVVSKVAVIDLTADTILTTIDCEGYNFAQFVTAGDTLFVLNSGDAYNTKTHATIEMILTSTGAISTLQEGLLNGSPILALAHIAGTQFYATAYDGWGDVPVYHIDAAQKKILQSVDGVVSAFGGIAYAPSKGQLYIGENGTNYGVSVYDEQSDSLWTIPTTLNPSSLAIQ